MPAVTGLITLLYMGMAAALIVNLLGIKSKVFACLFAAVWITFPGLACYYSFGVNTDAGCLSVLLAVLAGFLLDKKKYSFLLGSIVLCFSLGIYQPFMSLTIGIVFIILLKNALSEEFEIRSFCTKVAKGIVMLALGFILYYLVLKISLLMYGTTLSSYHGVDDMTSFSLRGIIKGFIYSYIYFIQYFFTTAYNYTWGRAIFNLIAATIFLMIIFKVIISNNKNNKKLQNIALIIIICLLPLGVNATPFLLGDRVGTGVDRYMMFSLMLLWAVFIMALDIGAKRKLFLNKNLEFMIQSFGSIAIIVAIVTGYIISNQAYHRMEAMTTSTDSLCNRIVARIEVMPEWNKDIPTYFANCENIMNENMEVIIPEYEDLEYMPGTGIFPFYSDIALASYMEVYLHFPVELASDEQKEAILLSEEFDNMPIYPTLGSVALIDGVMVVKFNETQTK